MPSEVKNGTPSGLSLGDDGDRAKDYRQMCKYGKGCYQKNPMHHQKFRHPKEDDVADSVKGGPAEDDVEKEPEGLQEGKDEETPTPAKKLKFDTDPEPETKAAEDAKDRKTFADGEKVSVEKLLKLSNEERIKEVYNMSMPDDFYSFWEFCYAQNRENPWEALVRTYGLRLVGPYELLTRDGVEKKSRIFDGESVLVNDLVCNDRFYHDPPEMQTVLASVDPGDTLHFGYFRDDPKEMPTFVVFSGGPKEEESFSGGLSSSARLHLLGDNLFGAMYKHIQKVIMKADPFRQTALQKVKEALHVHATLKSQQNDFSLEVKTQTMKARDKKKLSQTFHGAGMVVPYNKDTQVGYREIPESVPNLKKIFRDVVEADKGDDQDEKNKALDALQELITNVQYANDEGDPGMGLELGINAFVFGGKALNSGVRHLLSVAYELLDRETFGEVAMAHLLRRDESKPFFKAYDQQQN